MKHNWVFVKAEDDEFFDVENEDVVKGISLLYLCANPGCDKYLSFIVRREGIPMLLRFVTESQLKVDVECTIRGCECHGV